MKIISIADYEELSTAASEVVAQAVSLQPTLNIVFPPAIPRSVSTAA